MPRKGKTKKLADALKKCHISSASNETSAPTRNTVIFNNNDPTRINKWPQVIQKVPDIFLHKPVDFKEHVSKLLALGVKFYQPILNTLYTKIKCPTFEDYESLIEYLNNAQLPYHTFGLPDNRKLKVVIKGLPKDVDLQRLNKQFSGVDIPIIRIHKMHRKESSPNSTLYLVVVPHNEKGRKLVNVTKVLGFKVKMEPPKVKTRQCHRCQRWGHSQRYCQGEIRCVKCAGSHFHTQCERDRSEEPPKCANCDAPHTASYRRCPYCPDSTEHKATQFEKVTRRILAMPKYKKPVLVTTDNCDNLYKNIKFTVSKE